jgi:energy-coupling factor transporter transmembrane protein EcfT
MKNITFGKYIKRNSAVHSFHPIPKFIITLAIIIIIGLNWNFNIFLFYTLSFFILLKLSNIKLNELYLILKQFRYLLLATFIFQFLFTGSDFFTFNMDKLATSSIFTLRFLLLISYSALFTLTTPATDIVKTLNFIFKPLNFLGINMEKFSLTALIALRFIPILFNKSSKILSNVKKQKNISFFKKLDLFLIKLFEVIFNYTDKLSIFLSKQTNLNNYLLVPKIKKNELITSIFILLIVCGGLFV